MYHGWVRIFVASLFFLQLQKWEINDKGGDLCQVWRNVRGGKGIVIFVTKRDGGSWVGQKRVILASRIYWTTPYLISVLKTLIKENKFFEDLRISADLADSALGYRGIFEGWKVGCTTYLKIYIKMGQYHGLRL